MELDNIFILKQFVAIDELKPSSISSAMDEFCEVYARAVLKLLFLLTEEENFYAFLIGNIFSIQRTGQLLGV